MPVNFDGLDDNLSTTQDGASGTDTDITTTAMFVQILAQPSANKSAVDFEDSLVGSTIFRTIEIVAPASTGFRPRWFHQFSTTAGIWRVTADLNLNQWYQVIITYDASNIANDPTIYVDQISVAFTEIQTPVGTRNTGFDTLFLGGSSLGENVHGNIAFPCVDGGVAWDTAQINRHYWYGHPGGAIELAYPLITNDYTNKGTVTTANLTANNGPITVSAITNATKGFVLLRSCT